MVTRIGPVLGASAIGDVSANVYRTNFISVANTEAITVYAAQTNLLSTLEGQTRQGQFLNRATSHLPAVVLGASAATALGIDRVDGMTTVWLGNQWFSVVGILRPLTLVPELDRSALIGFPVAESLLRADGSPVQIYVRTDPTSVAAVQSVLAATVDPAAPQDVSVANPTDALTARADASAAFQSLFLALGAVALLVGGIGIANVMVIGVLERRGEIGLRRALGAQRAPDRDPVRRRGGDSRSRRRSGGLRPRSSRDRRLRDGASLAHRGLAPAPVRRGCPRPRCRGHGRALPSTSGLPTLAGRGAADRLTGCAL